ncbi:hypothetical protein DYB26_001002 [Aphanomyces astaci]|uniref:Uncharacterized protein n=1 Tax=Aphanomyces astaci TaxID=112090 RepID=A0A396ZV42_APHAT|nr:hypothetical protein DYB36_003665 [Aphanomyces astaci]RHY97107.1 hypothetical protein DYB26_001002 [Aphanomyces astaci]
MLPTLLETASRNPCVANHSSPHRLVLRAAGAPLGRHGEVEALPHDCVHPTKHSHGGPLGYPCGVALAVVGVGSQPRVHRPSELGLVHDPTGHHVPRHAVLKGTFPTLAVGWHGAGHWRGHCRGSWQRHISVGVICLGADLWLVRTREEANQTRRDRGHDAGVCHHVHSIPDVLGGSRSAQSGGVQSCGCDHRLAFGRGRGYHGHSVRVVFYCRPSPPHDDLGHLWLHRADRKPPHWCVCIP